MRHLASWSILAVACAACSSSSSSAPDVSDAAASLEAGGGSGSGGGSGGGGGGGSGGGDASAPRDASAPPPNDGGGLAVYGPVHTGEYELGPVEWTGSFTNSCGPYASSIEQMEGIYLAGLDNSFNADGSLCDACILMKTAKGKSIVLRVVTTGVSQAPTNADISQEAYSLINENEYPRTMTWQLVECPNTGTLQYQYQTQANVDWTSLWVRNGRVPITKVEVMSAKHSSWFALTRGSDGTLTDNGGFGSGAFQLRITGMDGNVVTDSFSSFAAGSVVASKQQLQ